jgi:beta-galactosidase
MGRLNVGQAGDKDFYKSEKNPLDSSLKVGKVSNLSFRNITAKSHSKMASSITAAAGHYVENVTLENIQISTMGHGTREEADTSLREYKGSYPENRMYGLVYPSSGLFFRHVKNLKLNKVNLEVRNEDYRPAVVLDDAPDVQIDSLTGTAPAGEMPFVKVIPAATAQKASSRVVYSINECWNFEKGADVSVVNIPHTWNTEDAIDDAPGYYRGKAWYRKSIPIPAEMKNRQAYIYFEGANQETELFINGVSVGRHIGGYTRFCFDITPFLKYGAENLFAIQVDNSANKDIPPLSADFTFWGGIYRDLYLTFTHKLHFTTTDYASSGIYIDADVSAEQASINPRVLITNEQETAAGFRIETTLISPAGEEIVKDRLARELAAHAHATITIPPIKIEKPLLWSTESPNIYTVCSRIYDEKDCLVDEIRTPVGLRWFSFSPDSGFSLNGKPCKLIGTNRHQDYYKKGNALRDEMHVRDIKLLKEMGGNFLRISHYPQDPVVMEMCDKLGILTSVEIPIVNTISESEAFHNNSVQMAKEMIHQDYNRPSIIIWAYMNEVLLHPLYGNDSIKQERYFKAVHQLAQEIDDLIRKTDAKRYTMMAYHGSFEAYHKAGLDRIPMILGWNLYQGWYSGVFADFDKFVAKLHSACPDKPLMITEYGADVAPQLHSFAPRRFDFTVEYGNLYHEHYLKSIRSYPFIAGATIWNLNDFYSEARKDAMPHVNNKGITGLDRTLKETYFLYQAALKQEPVLKIGARDWKTRGGLEDPLTNSCLQPIRIYTNLAEIEILLNGKSLGVRQAIDHVVKIDAPFQSGENVIEAVGHHNGVVIRDMLRVDFQMIPADLNKFTEINVLLGSHRYFEDREAAIIWIPEKEYTPGSWGYIGGQPYERTTRRGALNNSDKDVADTDQDPIFQTQRVGIESFKIDVPNGSYSIYCYWAALDTDNKQEALIYNLGNDAIATNTSDHLFDVAINDVTMLYDFDPAQASQDRGIIKKFNVNVSNREGITIKFDPKRGKAALNALRIYRSY